MEHRLAVHARATRQALSAWAAAVVVLASAPASAAPRTPDAKAAFDRGVSAYQKKDYAGASAALGKSFALEADVETLFAWAQAERQQDHCDKAIELYRKILAFDLPEENKQVVRTKLDECKAIVATAEPAPVTTAAPEPEDRVVVVEPPEHATPHARARWKDPVGVSLVGLGAIGLGIGGYFLISSSTAATDSKLAKNYFDVIALRDRAESRGKIGLAATATGGALLIGGIVWYATHGKQEKHGVTGWLSPSGGGLAAAGRF